MSPMPSDDIHLARETLRAELAALELRLVDRLTASLSNKADLNDLNAVEKRLIALEIFNAKAIDPVVKSVPSLEDRVMSLEKTGFKVQGAWAVITLLGVALAGVAGLVLSAFSLTQ